MSSSTLAKYVPLRGGWLWASLVVLVGVGLLMRLGFWQLERLAQRRAHNALVLARIEEAPLALTGQPVDPDQVDLRRAFVRGTYDFSQEVTLRNRAEGGVPGVHLLTPLRISGSDQAVLIDRGWIPLDPSAPGAHGIIERPEGEVEVRGIIRQSRSRPNRLSPADPPLSADRPRLDAWFRVDIPRIQEQIPYPLMPVFVEEGEVQTGVVPAVPPPGVLPRPSPDIELGEGSHLGYAVQWFSFAIILLVGYIALYLHRPNSI